MNGSVWVYQYDIAALVYLLVIFLLLRRFKDISTESNKAFRLLLWSGILTTIFDLLGVLVLVYSNHVPVALNYAIQILYMLFLYGCGLSYYHLTYTMVSPFRKSSVSRKILISLVSIVDVGFLITSPFTKLVFYLEPQSDGTYSYHHGPVLYVLYGIAVFLMILCLYDALRYHRLLTKAQHRTVYTWTIACIAAMAIQVIFVGVNMICFAISISSLLAYFALQNPQDYEDKLTGLNNASGFSHVLSSYFRRGDKLSFICIEYNNFEYTKQLFGEETLNRIIVKLSRRLQTIAVKSSIFHPSENRFVINMPHLSENLHDMVNKVINMSDEPIMIDGAQMKYIPTICVIHFPESVSYAEDVPETIDYALKETAQTVGPRSYYEVRESAIIKNHRESAVAHILQRAITNDEFKLAIQPIYRAQDRSIICAEACARLEDNTLGCINPEEFIPIAEKNGMIIRLGQLVLETVCRFIETNLQNGISVDFISINLSPVQCLQPDLADSIISTIKRHNIDPSMIAFEITPDAAKNSLETLVPNMRRLTDFGVMFLIDRYTINLSAAAFLSALPFKGIKIAKEMVMAAYHNGEILSALKNVIATFKQANFKVVAIGIETKDISESFTVLGCDYLQGFYLSKPLSKDEFLEEISK